MMQATIGKDATAVELVIIKTPGVPVDEKDELLRAAVDKIHEILNKEIRDGISYPQVRPPRVFVASF